MQCTYSNAETGIQSSWQQLHSPSLQGRHPSPRCSGPPKSLESEKGQKLFFFSRSIVPSSSIGGPCSFPSCNMVAPCIFSPPTLQPSQCNSPATLCTSDFETFRAFQDTAHTFRRYFGAPRGMGMSLLSSGKAVMVPSKRPLLSFCSVSSDTPPRSFTCK